MEVVENINLRKFIMGMETAAYLNKALKLISRESLGVMLLELRQRGRGLRLKD
jgi:hypothetical protein